MATNLIDAHIIQEGKQGLYSPFEERIIFPIRDHLGRYVGFGGRVFQPVMSAQNIIILMIMPFLIEGTCFLALIGQKKRLQNQKLPTWSRGIPT